MKKRLLALLMATVLIIGSLAACGDGGNTTSTDSGTGAASSSGESATDAGNSGVEPAAATDGPDDTTEPYSFTVYYNYTGWSKQWGLDEGSKYMSEKFNVDINWYGPESDPDSKLNLMITSDDLPEMIILDRGPNLNKIARAGFLQDLSQYMYEGNDYSENVTEDTRELLKIDGVLYGIPNWARSEATGGNYYWIVNTSAYEAVGSPSLETFEDMHDYALAVKEAGLTSYSGQDMYPFWCTNTDNGYYVYWPFYMSLGMPNLVDSYFTKENRTIQYCVESDNFVKALKMANEWYNEGLFTAEVFTDNSDQFLEKITNARPALLWYDFSQDDTNNFRRIVREKTNNETSYEVLGSDAFLPDNMLLPGAEGVEVTYGAEDATVGWNVNCITTTATNPQRIFDLFSWMLSKDGSILQMYGPEGGLWEGKDEDGNPILKKAQSEFTSAELDAAGAWFWTQPADSTNIDRTKFAVNDKESPETKNWVVDLQAHMSSFDSENPRVGQKFVSNESVGLTDEVDPQGELGIARQTIIDYSKAQLPKIIMAKDDAEFDSLIADLLSYVKAQNVDGVIEAYQAKYDANVELQGYSAYDEDYDLYRIKS